MICTHVPRLLHSRSTDWSRIVSIILRLKYLKDGTRPRCYAHTSQQVFIDHGIAYGMRETFRIIIITSIDVLSPLHKGHDMLINQSCQSHTVFRNFSISTGFFRFFCAIIHGCSSIRQGVARRSGAFSRLQCSISFHFTIIKIVILTSIR